jgi:hypothetical protein
MCKEVWESWQPFEIISNDYFFSSAKYLGRSLNLFFRSRCKQKKDLKFTFNCSVFFYNITDENCQLLRIGYLNKNYKGKFCTKK